MTREKAIKIIKEFIKGTCLHLVDQEALETLIPELKESEDERIRKEIVEYFKHYSGGDNVSIKFPKWIAYLEKQKEHSMSAEEVLVRAGLKPYKDGNQWCILAGDNIQEGICGFGDTIDEALYEFLKEVIDLQKEPHYTKRNALFDKCVENCDPEIMQKVSDEIDEMLQKEQKPEESTLTDFEQKLYTVISIFVGEYERDKEANLIKFVKEWSSDLLEPVKVQEPAECIEDSVKFEEGFKAGAEWQKEKMLKNVVEGEVHPDDCEIWANLVGYGYKFNDGDKVRIVVLKEEEQ